MALCPSDAARLELSRLGADLNLGASSPEWIVVVLYAESRGIFGTATETDRTDFRAQLDRIEMQMTEFLAKTPFLTDIRAQLERIETRMAAPPTKTSSPIMIVSPRMRDLLLFTSTILLCVAFAAAFGAAAAPFVVVIAAFAVGLCTTIAYCWLAPMFSSEK
jgi:anti-sigma-K factor RskA